MLGHPGFCAWGIAACCAVALGSEATARAQFTPGNVVVSVSGTNPTAGAPSIAPLSLVEYTRGGVPTGYVLGLPSADTPVATGTNYAIAGTTQSTALYGALKRSVDGRFLTITGANVPVATGTDALTFGVFSTASFPNRVIARIDAAGSVDTTTRFAARGAIPNGVITTDGTSMWWASDTGSLNSGGVRYLTLGSTVAGPQLTGIDLSPDSRTNTNGIGIFDGQLYVAYNVNPFRGVYALGTGLQQSGGPLVATTVVSSTSATDFFFANANTLYVAVSNTNPLLQGLGLQKWVRSGGGPWTNVWAANPAATLGIRGIAGSIEGESVDIFGVTLASTNAETPNSLLRVVDTLAGTSFPGFETIATSSSNSLFRGVAFAPVPEPVAWALGLAGLGLTFARRIIRRRSSAARSRRYLARYGILLWAALGGAVAQGQFRPDTIVVSVSGTNPMAGDPTIAPLSLIEFTTSGNPTGTVVGLPMVDTPIGTGTNYAITGSRNASLYGALKRSVNREYLTITAANVPADTGTSALIGGVFSTGGFPNRTIARIDAAGNVNTSTRFAARGSTPRGVASTDGVKLWWAADSGSGDSGGVRYLTLGGTVAGPILTGVGTSTSSRSATQGIGIFADQLYVPYDVATFRGVYALGNGLPESGGPLLATAVVSATSARDFYFADPNTLYVAVSNTNAAFIGIGLQKWIRSDGQWSNAWSSNPAGTFGILGLTGTVNGGSVDVFAVTFAGTDPVASNSLVKLGDTLAGTQFPGSGFTVLATATAGSLFRGVAFAPVPEPAAVALGLAGLAAVAGSAAVATRRRKVEQRRR